MRDIKFRVWDTDYEKMTYFDDEEYEYKPPLVFRLDQVFKKDSNYDDYEDFEYNDVTDSVEVMQYTGLKDKNRKEIYEGDILLAPEWFGKLKCVCIYQQENTVNPIQGFGLYSYDTYFQKYNTLVESDEWDEFEVIGNIYDNKNLLEVTE